MYCVDDSHVCEDASSEAAVTASGPQQESDGFVPESPDLLEIWCSAFKRNVVRNTNPDLFSTLPE